MPNNVFHTGLDIRSIAPIDKRMYIDDITTVHLTERFGLNGAYAIPKAVLFNRTTNAFHYYTSTVAPSPNILNPSNWAQLSTGGSGGFVQWSTGANFTTGATVYMPPTTDDPIRYFIAVQNSSNQNPIANSLYWFEIGSGGSSRSTTTTRLVKNGNSRTISVIYSGINVPDLPIISVFGLFVGDGIDIWKPIEPSMSIDQLSSTIQFTFTGDLENSAIRDVDNNIKIVVL